MFVSLITRSSPPYCTRVTKDSSYSSIARFDYAIAYIEQGQTEAYQQLFCVNPAAVNKAVTTVCDWSAPPQVHFLLGDEYVHVVRQDPTGRFRGNAEILTYQFCGHRLNVSSTRSIPDVKVTAFTPDTAKGVTVFEYGIHLEGEKATFAMTGMIPALTQIYTVNATPSHPGYENKLSFIKVEYDSPMSPVEISFTPNTAVLVFYVRFPFTDIPFGIVGYSLKVKPEKTLRSKKKCLCPRRTMKD
ncbi:hypothetical protein PYW07_007905 [Mythimna separata]|uniref:Uncharacterized protein n=1 Tax=Mythimna separata TaxID=271217 RepID=A0AAD7YP89_MYTSE|nr:hypothetical protein PYW07_007905 [Mythimna separata]